MFFPLILWLVGLQRYGYKPMLSPPRETLARVTSQTHASTTFATLAWVMNKPLHGFPTLPTSAFSALLTSSPT